MYSIFYCIGKEENGGFCWKAWQPAAMMIELSTVLAAEWSNSGHYNFNTENCCLGSRQWNGKSRRKCLLLGHSCCWNCACGLRSFSALKALWCDFGGGCAFIWFNSSSPIVFWWVILPHNVPLTLMSLAFRSGHGKVQCSPLNIPFVYVWILGCM